MELYLHQNLDRQTTKTAILPQILQRGTKKHPTMKAMERGLSDLYGAVIFNRLFKKGERHFMGLSMSVPSEPYLRKPEPMLEKNLAFFADLFISPRLEEGRFLKEYTIQEKKALEERLESIYNDKQAYAYKRCIENMCADEEYRRHPYGSSEDIEALDEEILTTYYQTVKKENPVEIYVLGDVDPEKIYQICCRVFAYPRDGRAVLQPTVNQEAPLVPKEVVEYEPVKQGKLIIGCRTKFTARDPEYFALMMYNQILGGGGHSKLFAEVREKASLAYYASSSLETGKGLLMIQAGIDTQDEHKAKDIIDRQLLDMAEGKITDQEWQMARETLLESLDKLGDQPGSLIQLSLNNRLYQRTETLAEIKEKVQSLSREEVIYTAREVKKDTVYFLTEPKGGEKGHEHGNNGSSAS